MEYKQLLLVTILISIISISTVNAQTVKDFDGNVYGTITIGTQIWMAENLKTTHFRNGDAIKTTNPASLDIRNETSPIYQWASGGKENNVEVYGRLYTWYAITDSRGVCPIGWHIPSDAEWTMLISFLGGDVTAYSKLKESGDVHWKMYDTGTNETAFTALPGGIRNSSGPFYDIGSSGGWWSSTEYGKFEGWYRLMDYKFSSIYRYLLFKRNGLSVRCVMSK